MRFLARRFIFFKKRQIKKLSVVLPQVELVVDGTAWAPDVFPYPRLTCSVTVTHNGRVIGSLQYGIHSKDECLYVLFVEIHPAHRRQHFGLAVLSALYQRHHLPLVPVGVLDTALPFWSTALQRLATQGMLLAPPCHAMTHSMRAF